MAFTDHERRKHKHFLEKNYAGARANIEQKLYGASLRDSWWFCNELLGSVLQTLSDTPVYWLMVMWIIG